MEISKKDSLSRGDKYSSIFQAEIYVVLKCATTNLHNNYLYHTIYINSDSQAALLALASDTKQSKLVERF